MIKPGEVENTIETQEETEAKELRIRFAQELDQLGDKLIEFSNKEMSALDGISVISLIAALGLVTPYLQSRQQLSEARQYASSLLGGLNIFQGTVTLDSTVVDAYKDAASIRTKVTTLGVGLFVNISATVISKAGSKISAARERKGLEPFNFGEKTMKVDTTILPALGEKFKDLAKKIANL